MAKRVRAYIGLGSNQGDREATLSEAVRALAADRSVRMLRVSSLYETDPVGPPPQGPYLNGAVGLLTSLSPTALLDLLQRIESEAGRVREGVPRWSARTLDLDLLLFGDQLIEETRLQVPHPRLAERAFVLEPLAEIAPGVLHPATGEAIEALAARARAPGAVQPHSSESWRLFAEASTERESSRANETKEQETN